MPGSEGNKNGLRFKTKKEREKMFTNLFKHLEEGLSKDAFPDCDWDTVQYYIKEYAFEFPTLKQNLQDAERKGRAMWEGIGKRQAVLGKGNASTYIFTMKNKYPNEWKDKRELDHTTLGKEMPTPILSSLQDVSRNNSNEESTEPQE